MRVAGLAQPDLLDHTGLLLDNRLLAVKREIEAHTDELGDTETGRYVIDEAAQLLTALRLCAQSQYRTRSPGARHLVRGDVGPGRILRERGRRPLQPLDRQLDGCVRGPA